MHDFITPENKHLFVDMAEIRKLTKELNEKMGFVKIPGMTPEKVRAMMIESGINPEDNIFSCGIIAARDEE